MFTDEVYPLFGKTAWPISTFTNSQLLRTYISILSDLEGAGEYEPVAEGIRTQWAYRSLDSRILLRIDRNFKKLRRETKEKR